MFLFSLTIKHLPSKHFKKFLKNLSAFSDTVLNSYGRFWKKDSLGLTGYNWPLYLQNGMQTLLFTHLVLKQMCFRASAGPNCQHFQHFSKTSHLLTALQLRPLQFEIIEENLLIVLDIFRVIFMYRVRSPESSGTNHSACRLSSPHWVKV